MKQQELRIPLMLLSPLSVMTDEMAGQLLKQVYQSMNHEPVTPSSNTIIEVIVQQIISYNLDILKHKKYISQIRSKAGEAGGRAKAANAVSSHTSPPPPTQETSGTDTETDQPIIELQEHLEPLEPNKEPEAKEINEVSDSCDPPCTPPAPVLCASAPSPTPIKRFTPPTSTEVQSYLHVWCGDKGYPIDELYGQKFCCFYASNGWKVGKNAMKDWKSAARGWVIRDRQKNQSASSQSGREEISTKQFTEF